MKETENSGRVPRLRFPEFREAGEWSPKTIDETCVTFSGGTPITSNKEFYGGSIPFIRSAEIGRDQTELFLSRKGLLSSSAKMVQKGDVLIALYGANSGDVALAKISGSINQAILCVQHESNNAFVYNYLYHKKDWIVSTYIQGGQGNLSCEIIKSINLSFPSSSEQQKIADCLASLDELLTLEAQKLGALKTHKKGLMQQLFPAEGETVPRLRFPEFREADWDEISLNEVGTFTGGGTPSTKKRDYWTGENPWISSSDLSEESIFSINITRHISDKAIVDSATKVVPENSVLIVSRVGIGKVAITRKAVCTSQDFTSLTPKNDDPVFLGFYLKTLVHVFLSLNQGMAIKGFTKDDISKLKIFRPSRCEQIKIADCLSSLDDLITFEAQKLDALKTHKKGLMQQIFPALDEVQG